MNITIYPSQLTGNLLAPASKSSMQRACAAALLKKGVSRIKNPGHSNDDLAAIGIIKALGATVENDGKELVIKSKSIQPVASEINCGESGLSIRMFTSIAALSNKEITINGSGSLQTRPMDFFDKIFPELSVKIKTNSGKLPITIQGPLIPANIEVDGSLSSQFLTGLLMAYSAAKANNVSIKVKNLKSKPYVNLTLDVMKKFGMIVPENRNYEEFIFKYDSPEIPPLGGGGAYTVESDWSGGAFLLVAGAIAGPIVVKGLDLQSTQADKAILQAMKNANVSFTFDENGINVQPCGLRGFEFDATDCPDLFPPLVALAAYCDGETKIKGVHRLTHKESNRTKALQEEFLKIGVKIKVDNDNMIIQSPEKVVGAKVHSHHDHRIAMACAVAALKADGKTTIENADAVSKSYPDFYNDLKKLGAAVESENKTYNNVLKD